MSMPKVMWLAWTPGGTPLMETKAKTEKGCWRKLMRNLRPMYPTRFAAEQRGYEVLEMEQVKP